MAIVNQYKPSIIARAQVHATLALAAASALAEEAPSPGLVNLAHPLPPTARERV